MSRKAMWYVAAVLLVVAAIASFISSNVVMGLASAVLALCMVALGAREKGTTGRNV